MQLPTEAKITSHRPVIGKLIVAYKKLVRLLIAPYLRTVFKKEHEIANERFNSIDERFNSIDERFNSIDERFNSIDERFNSITTDILNRTDSLFVTLDKRLESFNVRQEKIKAGIEKRQEELDQRLETKVRDIAEALQKELKERQEDIGKRHTDLFQRQMELNQGHILLRRRLENILSDLKKVYPQTEGSLKNIISHGGGLEDHDYFVFENIYRGTREEIARRQEIYIPYFVGRKNAIDVGCGRGEFIELLRNNNIESYGIDINEDMLYYCKEKGLNTKKAEALSYLNCLEDNSLEGIFSAHFIEHLPKDKILPFIKLCHRKLRSGSYCIFETPNPTSLIAFTRNFLIDPFHQSPLHPEALKFLAEISGFKEIEIRYLAPFPEENKLQKIDYVAGLQDKEKEHVACFNKVVERLNDILYGYQDYAVIMKKNVSD